jgi:ABC-type transporter Mla subunit MlaD
MEIHRIRVLTSLFIVSCLLLSAFLAAASAAVYPSVPEFPVTPEVVTSTALLAITYLALRRKNRSK